MDYEEQFACLKQLDMGNRIVVTDMTGAQFFYEVAWIERQKSVDEGKMDNGEFQLSLFVRDTLSMEYVIVRCHSI